MRSRSWKARRWPPRIEPSAQRALVRDGPSAVPFCYCNSCTGGALYNPSDRGDVFIRFGSGFVIAREAQEESVKKVSLHIVILLIALLLSGCQPAAPRSAPPPGVSFFPTAAIATVALSPMPAPTSLAPDAQTWIAFLRDD